MNTNNCNEIKPIVYIVDDDAMVRRAIQRLLNSIGLDVKTFATTDEFLNHEIREHSACLITDVKMPKMSGLELQEKLISGGNKIPVIFITGFDNEEIREKVKRAGAVGYLSKPIDDRALLDTIKWALSR